MSVYNIHVSFSKWLQTMETAGRGGGFTCADDEVLT